MPANTIFLLVEGPHDAEFMARLLKARGFEQRTKLSAIPKPFHDLFPAKYPATEETPLIERHPVPGFYQNADQWLIMLVGGGSKSSITLAAALRSARIAEFTPDAIGVFVDQDQEATPEDARDRFIDEFIKEEDLPVTLNFKFQPGTVVQDQPRVGLFVLPDNQNTGALEDLLLDCGEENYKELKDKALAFRDDTLLNAQLTTDDLKEYGQPAGQKHISKKKKAWVSAMGAILVPAAAIQNSIRKNRWLEGAALNLPKIQAVSKFLDELIA
jgi:hypothetical protein